MTTPSLPAFHSRDACVAKVLFTVLIALCGVANAADAPVAQVTLQVHPQIVLNRIAPDFIGFGYEKSIIAIPGYFSPKNRVLQQLYLNLCPQGLIRIGGNVSDHTQYVPDGTSAARSDSEVTIINKSNLTDFAGFLDATGWRVMWGLNLGTGSKGQATAEAVAVDTRLSKHLQSFEIGNEVDLRGGYTNRYNNYDGYYSLFSDYKAAIRGSVPHSVFSGPDVAGSLNWLKSFADTDAKDLQLLLLHHYRCGADQPQATIENLLKPDNAWETKLKRVQKICQAANVPFRINEINSFYGGGKQNVSDTFASALWCLDQMYLLASYGCDGVNIETDINQHAWISHYSPIVRDDAMNCTVRPEYYGMLAFAMAGKESLVELSLTKKDDLNLSAFATRDEHGVQWITAINKDDLQDASLAIDLPEGDTTADAYRLTAPAVDSKDHVTFAGTAVSTDGHWKPGPAESLAINKRKTTVAVPRTSAVVIRLR